MNFINQERENIKIYKRLYKRYGNSFKSLDWGSKEKQMLIETKNINDLASNMMSLLEINSAGETKNLN